MGGKGVGRVRGGTAKDTMWVGRRSRGVRGDVSEGELDRAGITCNKNGIPFDPEKPFVT